MEKRMRIVSFLQVPPNSYNGFMSPTTPVCRSPIRLAVLISAGGTTLQNLIERIHDGRLDAEIVLVISSHPDVQSVQRAKTAGLPTIIITKKETGSRAAFGQSIFDRIRAAQADLVCLAGFLELLPIPEDFAHRVINIHPSLIPAFCGKGYYGHHVHESALATGVKVTGCTVHFADNEFDHGPIILQRTVPVLDNDTPETLAARVFDQECEAFPEAIRLFAEGLLQVNGRRVLTVGE
jgi:formyltetrahydrofolate-dependent phosphoribosylglycinamide formyltransferase